MEALEVTNHSSELGRWRTAKRSGAPRLRDYVLGYFASAGFLPYPLLERHLPSREVALVLNFGPPHRIISPSDPRHPTEHRTAWIVALQHRHQIREALGSRDFMVIRLTPVGAHMLLRTPMNLLTDRILSVEEVDSRFSQLLRGSLEGLRDWRDRLDAIENIIAARLASAPKPPAGLLQSWKMLQGSPNHIDLAGLPEEFGCSRRHLIAQFHKYVGMSPKTIARISRFHLAVAAIHHLEGRDRFAHPEGIPYLDSKAGTGVRARQSVVRWTDLALDCGYYDQSHFINEFRAFSGLSPLEFLRRTSHE